MKSFVVLAFVARRRLRRRRQLRSPPTSSTIALTSDDRALWVVNPDADSVTVIDPATRTALAEIALGPTPTVDAAGRFEPPVKPRALAILPNDTQGLRRRPDGQRASSSSTSRRAPCSPSIPVGAAPVGVVAAPDGSAVYAISHEAAVVTKIDPHKDAVVATLRRRRASLGRQHQRRRQARSSSRTCSSAPASPPSTRAASRSSARRRSPSSRRTTPRRFPQGVVRGVYAVVPQPTTGVLWAPHLLLAIHTPEPALDFQSTVFPAVSTLDPTGASRRRAASTSRPSTTPSGAGAFNDVVSGPRALAFTPDGRLALVADSPERGRARLRRQQAGRGRPGAPAAGRLPRGHRRRSRRQATPTCTAATRRTSWCSTLDADNALAPAAVDGDPIATRRRRSDAGQPAPRPAPLLHGQLGGVSHHAQLLGRLLELPPRGLHRRGHLALLRRPARHAVERGRPHQHRLPLAPGAAQLDRRLRHDHPDRAGRLVPPHRPEPRRRPEGALRLRELRDPVPQNPNLAADGTLTAAQEHGKDCSCSTAAPATPASTSPTPALAIPRSISTGRSCSTTSAPASPAATSPISPRPTRSSARCTRACDFDTPTLRGIFATAPYFHDGSAATLRDVVDRLPFTQSLGDDDRDALVAYVKTL